MIDACPDLEALEAAPLADDVRAHVATCPACCLVLDVFAAQASPSIADACAPFDALLAARRDGSLGLAGGNLLDRHLASCELCRDVAESLSPQADARGDLPTLPRVDPGAYALGLEVARGGMGRILSARDLRIGRPVAIKELLVPSPQLAARFEREARVTARLQHPGIVPIYEIGQWPDGTPFYSMRLVDGRTLREAIDGARTLAERVALLPAIIAASEAIAFAHEHRVIHRDLTPSNVLVGAFGETVVIDWGLAKDLSEPATVEVDGPYRGAEANVEHLTNQGTVLGTAPYMPPEQAHGREVDERADVYALGAILYHVLAGAAPYQARSALAVLEAVRAGPPRSLDVVARGTPGDLVSIVGKAMARSADARYPTARELADELKRFQAGRMVEARAYSRTEKLLRFLRRNRAVVTLGAIALGVLAVVAIASVTRIVRSREEARATVRFVLEEQGRAELLDGNTLRALAYFDAAYEGGSRSPSLMFLFGIALPGLSAEEMTLDCGDSVHGLAFSADGKDVAAACHDLGKIWHFAGGEPIVLAHHPGGYDGLAYSHDGRVVATWGADGVSRLWDAKTGAARGEYRHGATITFTTFSPDDDRLLTSGSDGTVKLWQRDRAEPIRTIVVTTGLLRDVYGVLSRDGSKIFATTIEGIGRGWNAATGETLGGYEHGSWVMGGEVATHGPERSVSCGRNKLAELWDATTGQHLRTFAGHTDVVFRCGFGPDGHRVLTTSHDGTARIWDADTGTLVTSVTNGDSVWTGHFSPDGERFLTVGLDGMVRVWDATTGTLLATRDGAGGKDANFSPDNSRIVVVRGDGRLRVWANTAGALRATFRPTGSLVGASSDGTRAVIENDDGAITLWNTSTGARVAHAAIRNPIAIGETRLVAAGSAGAIVVDLATGATVAELPVSGHLGLSRDGTRVLAGVDVWDVPTRTRVATFAGTDAILDDAGGHALAWSASEVTLWSVGEVKSRASVPKPSGFRALGFADGGHRVVVDATGTGSMRAVTLWSETGDVVRRDPETIATSIDPTGTFVTTIGANHVVQIWRAHDGVTVATFVGSQLLRAQSNPSGELVVAITQHGVAAVVLSAQDGRVLARWPIEHGAAFVTQTEIITPSANAWWSRDGATIVTQGTTLGVWDAGARPTPSALAQIARYVPWRIVDGQVQLVYSRMHGRVTRRDAALGREPITVEIRQPPDDAGGQYNWDVVRSQVRTLRARTDDNGDFELEGLLPGEYVVTVRGKATIVQVSVADRDVELDVP